MKDVKLEGQEVSYFSTYSVVSGDVVVVPTVFLVQPSSRVDPDGAGESYEEGSGKDASVMGKVIQLNQRIGMLS